MPIMEIVTLLPEAKSVLAEYGLHCFSCAGSEFENLDDGCRSHGFSDEEIDELVDDLNRMLDDLPARPQMLVLTADAARAIKNVAQEEGQEDVGLEVIADASGGFCMEFCNDTRTESQAVAEGRPTEKTFMNPGVPGVRLFASSLTLKRIGGATIDFRDGRFKLDLPEDARKMGCGCSEESCDCRRRQN